MLKLQIPKDQVLQRMKKEGIEEKIIVAVVGVKLQQSGAVETKDDSKETNLFHFTGLHCQEKRWTRASGMQARSRMLRPQPEGSDISKLVELFQKKTNVLRVKDKKSDESVSSTAKAKLWI
jgi:hypothetical protein